MPPCEPVFQVIESGHNGENLEKVFFKEKILPEAQNVNMELFWYKNL